MSTDTEHLLPLVDALERTGWGNTEIIECGDWKQDFTGTSDGSDIRAQQAAFSRAAVTSLTTGADIILTLKSGERATIALRD